MKKFLIPPILFFMVACQTTADYEICDTPNCGDDVEVVVE